MLDFIIPLILGILFIFIGISNRKGNISTLHSYHRHRVSEEDKLPLGKKVGLGIIIIGSVIIIYNILSIITFFTNIQLFIKIGDVILITGLTFGCFITFYAIIKYNKGLF